MKQNMDFNKHSRDAFQRCGKFSRKTNLQLRWSRDKERNGENGVWGSLRGTDARSRSIIRTLGGPGKFVRRPLLHEDSGVCEKNTPPKNDTIRKIGFRGTPSGAGGQFPLLDCRARARVKGVVSFSQTPVPPGNQEGVRPFAPGGHDNHN